MNREDLHTDAENFDVWCERCQRVHKYYTFTREDLDHVVSEGAHKLADAIDAQALADVLAKIKEESK